MSGRHRDKRDEEFLGRRVVRGIFEAEADSEAAESLGEGALGAAVTCLGDMTSESVNWLWGDQLAVGKVTLLTGASGVGKSFVALRMVADVTVGVHGSVGARGLSVEEPDAAGDVLIISPEVELTDVVRPRLVAAGADVKRVHALRGIRRSKSENSDGECRAFRLDEDLGVLEQEIVARKEAGAPLKLVVIDPFPIEQFAYRYGAADLMRLMRELAEMAAWSQVAVLVVAENSTKLGGSWGNLNKVLHAGAQSVWTVVDGLEPFDERVFHPYPPLYVGPRDQEPKLVPDRLLLPVKAHLKPKSLGLAFRLDEGCVKWSSDRVEMTAEQYFAREDRSSTSAMLLEQDWSELSRATHWLKHRLAKGMTPLRDIKIAAAENDIAFSTLRRAFCGLKGVARRVGTSRLFAWALPDDETEVGRVPDWYREGQIPPLAYMLPPEENLDSGTAEQPTVEGTEGEEAKPDRLKAAELEPDEVVELPDGTITWKSTVLREAREMRDAYEKIIAGMKPVPD